MAGLQKARSHVFKYRVWKTTKKAIISLLNCVCLIQPWGLGSWLGSAGLQRDCEYNAVNMIQNVRHRLVQDYLLALGRQEAIFSAECLYSHGLAFVPVDTNGWLEFELLRNKATAQSIPNCTDSMIC